MIIKYIEKTVTLGKKTYTVIIPRDIDGFVNLRYIMDADRKTFQALCFSMMRLIENKNLIVWFPLWNNKPAKSMYNIKGYMESRCENFDVIFLSHALQFPLCNWKALRQKLKKAKGKYHKENFNFNWACNKAERLSKDFDTKKFGLRKKDTLKYSFKFDTHIFVGGVRSFTDFFNICADFLKKHSEDYFRFTPDMDWSFLPQDDKSIRFFDDPMEIGFWDRRYEEKHIYIRNNYSEYIKRKK